MDHHAHLLAETERYCAAAGISKARLATIVVNDGKFFDRISKGGDFTVRTFERFMRFFAEHPTTAPDSEAASGKAAREVEITRLRALKRGLLNETPGRLVRSVNISCPGDSSEPGGSSGDLGG